MALGPITDGENGWKVLAGARATRAIVDPAAATTSSRCRATRRCRDFAGPYSPALSAAAGEPDTGAAFNGQSIKFDFQAVNPTPDGSRLEIDFGNAAGTDRNNFLVIESSAGTGIRIAVSEPGLRTANFAATAPIRRRTTGASSSAASIRPPRTRSRCGSTTSTGRTTTSSRSISTASKSAPPRRSRISMTRSAARHIANAKANRPTACSSARAPTARRRTARAARTRASLSIT